MNKIIALGIIALACMVAMSTAMYGGHQGSYGYYPMYYGGGGGFGGSGVSGGLMGGGFFSIIIFLFILSFLGKGNLFGGKNYRRGGDY